MWDENHGRRGFQILAEKMISSHSLSHDGQNNPIAVGVGGSIGADRIIEVHTIWPDHQKI